MPTTDPGDKSPFDIEELFDRAEEIQAETGQTLDDAFTEAFTEAQGNQ